MDNSQQLARPEDLRVPEDPFGDIEILEEPFVLQAPTFYQEIFAGTMLRFFAFTPSRLQSMCIFWVNPDTLSSDQWRCLMTLLVHCSRLAHLTVVDNIMDARSVTIFATALPKCLYLETLQLLYSSLGGDALCEIIGATLQCTRLSKLSVTNASIIRAGNGHAVVRKLAEVLPCLRNLTALSLEGNGFDTMCMQILAPAIQQCASLIGLDLSGNPVGENGFRIIADMLPHLRTLTWFAMNSAHIQTEDMKILAPALSQCPVLGFLNVRANSIGSDGIRCISAVLPHCHALHTLCLDTASIDEIAALFLLSGIRQCPSLDYMHVDIRVDDVRIDAGHEIINRLKIPEELRFHRWAKMMKSRICVLMLGMRRRARNHPRLPSELYYFIFTEFLTNKDFLRHGIVWS